MNLPLPSHSTLCHYSEITLQCGTVFVLLVVYFSIYRHSNANSSYCKPKFTVASRTNSRLNKIKYSTANKYSVFRSVFLI